MIFLLSFYLKAGKYQALRMALAQNKFYENKIPQEKKQPESGCRKRNPNNAVKKQKKPAAPDMPKTPFP